jgi:hypothetical protein
MPDKRDVEDMQTAAGRIEEAAMSSDATKELIADVINRME